MPHSTAFRFRRFLNWFPLGLTYAAMYMGRENFGVVKGLIGNLYHLDKVQMGVVATVGFWTYGLAVALNGPLADRIGGRRAILVGSLGAGIMNFVIGMMFFSQSTSRLLVSMSLMWAFNMYFQSYGALSVVKVNSTWFHVKERGIFGGIFGMMISSGYFLAVTVGSVILAHMNWWMIWFIPSMAMVVMFLVDWLLVRNRPSHAGYDDFDTGDGSNAHHAEDTPLPLRELMSKVFHNPVIVRLIMAEFCTGFVRMGLMLYFTEYLLEVYGLSNKMPLYKWTGIGFWMGGLFGGLLCGVLSDKFFDSRRPPVAFIYYMVQIVLLCLLGAAFGRGTSWGPVWAIVNVALMGMFVFGVHGMLSGTASMDFGGRKAAATVAGTLDGVQYLGAGLTGFGLGWVIKHHGWDGMAHVAGHQPQNAWVWVGCILPFSLLGGLIMTTIWKAKPKGAALH